MTTLLGSIELPLEAWEDGSIRIAGSRVTLDSIVHEFKLGSTAEQICHSFPAVSLRAVYGAIFYYLADEKAVEEYLQHHEERAEKTKRFIEDRLDTKNLRERILFRRDQRVKA